MQDQDGRLPEQDIRGLGLAMRDLCEQTGALTLELTKEAGRAVYVPGTGLELLVDGTALYVTEAQLDEVGLVPAEPRMVGRELLDLIPDREPSDDEIYNRPGVEGGIGYSEPSEATVAEWRSLK